MFIQETQFGPRSPASSAGLPHLQEGLGVKISPSVGFLAVLQDDSRKGARPTRKAPKLMERKCPRNKGSPFRELSESESCSVVSDSL